MIVLSISLIIALSVVFLFELPMYDNLLHLLKMTNKKPLACKFCVAFWVAVIQVLCTWNMGIIPVAFCAPVMVIIIEGVINSLPVKF